MKIQSGLSEGQVVQRKGTKGGFLRILGTCAQDGEVCATISRQGKSPPGWKNVVVGIADQGHFTAALARVPQGGPYRLDLTVAKETCGIKVFFVGDVWLLAGQSNMEGVGNMTHPAPTHPLIRSFSMGHEWLLAKDPLHVLRESPDVCHHGGQRLTKPEAAQFRRTAYKGVGVGLFFAQDMLARTGVPQGLICAAHGGTSMSQWDPDQKSAEGASLYYSMLNSVEKTGQPVSGVLWYQGESDATEIEQAHYTSQMKKLVAAVRHDLRQPTLSWVVVQIGRVFDYDSQAAAWNSIQEQQRLLPTKIRNLQVVATIDLALDDTIHISSIAYPRLARRLARLADRMVHRNKKESIAPSFREARLHYLTKTPVGPMGPSIEIVFDHVVGGLQARECPIGFSVVTEDGKHWPFAYKTTLHGHIARLHMIRIPPPGARLHYGLGVMPVCNITDERDQSLPVFGRQPILKTRAYLPFVTSWRVTDVVKPETPLKRLKCPNRVNYCTTIKTHEDGFFNEHPQWNGKSGLVYFFSSLSLREPMKLQFLMGYDGPFRLWMDGAPHFSDLHGTNPCLPDQHSKTTMLKAGEHALTIAMDVNEGLAWGFMLRFLRRDLTRVQINAERYERPVYST